MNRNAPVLISSMARRTSSGQALVEFALILPLLTIFLFGIIQFGFLYAGQIGLTNAAREAARYASVLQTGSTSTASANGGSTYTELTTKYLQRAVPGYGSTGLVTTGAGRTAVCYLWYQNPDGASYSVRVRVQIQYRHPLFIPLVGTLVDGLDGSVDNRFRLGASEEMRVENTPLSPPDPGFAPCP